MNRPRDHIKVVSDEAVVSNAAVYYVRYTQDDAGEWQPEEIDIRTCVRAIGIDLTVGELARCTLETICPHIEAEAELASVLETYFKPKRLWRVRRWLQEHQRLIDVTTLSCKTRLWMRR